MREKIFSKFTNERRREYQIETSIWQENGRRYAEKRGLNPDVVPHLTTMKQNYECLKTQHQYLVPCEMREDYTLVFPYLTGSSIADRLMALAGEKDRAGFVCEVKAFRDLIIASAGETTMFEETPEFTEIFSEKYQELSGSEGVRYGNLDLTFDNAIVTDSGIQIIDYEWLLTCVVPVDFILFRAVYNFYRRYHSTLKSVAPEEELFAELGIDQKKYRLFVSMNESFNYHVFGGNDNYQEILKQYEKRTWHLDELFRKEQEYCQIFIDEGQGYSEEQSKLFPVQPGGKVQTIDVRFPEGKRMAGIRIDPTMGAAIVAIEEIVLYSADGKRITNIKQSTNTALIEGNTYVFLKPDPQIVLQTKKYKSLQRVEIKYKIIQMLETSAIW